MRAAAVRFEATPAGGWLATGFATGAYATALAALGEGPAAALMLEQLARVLPGGSSPPGGRPPAAAAAALRSQLRRQLLATQLVDWSASGAAHVRGGYSAPSFGELPRARALYRRPECGGALCFCGEATMDAMMTMSAAIESGRRAAAEVLAAIGKGLGRHGPLSRL